jgi:hypothetical protein
MDKNTKIEDGGQLNIECSKCGLLLCEVWITRPNFPAKYRITAHCSKCGDKSYFKEFTGGFHIGQGKIPYTDIQFEQKDVIEIHVYT